MEKIFQAPNGKYFWKKYDENGSIVEQSEVCFESEVEANEALKAGILTNEEVEEADELDGPVEDLEEAEEEVVEKKPRKRASKK